METNIMGGLSIFLSLSLSLPRALSLSPPLFLSSAFYYDDDDAAAAAAVAVVPDWV